MKVRIMPLTCIVRECVGKAGWVGYPLIGGVGIPVTVDISASESVKAGNPFRVNLFGSRIYANVPLKASKVVSVTVTVSIPILCWDEWESVNLSGSIGLVIAPTVPISITPLAWIEREIIDEERSI